MTNEETAAASVERTVTEADTATAWGAEFPAAASTPFVLGLAEVACHRAIAHRLEPGQISVGVRAEIMHTAPSGVGATLVAKARLMEERDHRLAFEVEVIDAGRIVATVRHVRAVVDRDRILELLEAS
jgi:predicted thioesterase